MHCYIVNSILDLFQVSGHAWPFVQTVNNPFKSLSVNHVIMSLLNLAAIVAIEFAFFQLSKLVKF